MDTLGQAIYRYTYIKIKQLLSDNTLTHLKVLELVSLRIHKFFWTEKKKADRSDHSSMQSNGYYRQAYTGNDENYWEE